MEFQYGNRFDFLHFIFENIHLFKEEEKIRHEFRSSRWRRILPFSLLLSIFFSLNLGVHFIGFFHTEHYIKWFWLTLFIMLNIVVLFYGYSLRVKAKNISIGIRGIPHPP